MKTPSITFHKELLSKFREAIKKEWIITNGLGGYASSTVLGINTRKYHGLLVAAFYPPGNRRVCLVKLDEEVRIENNIYPFGANEFQNGIFPKGHLFLKEFSVSPFPEYTYAVKDFEVQKAIFMPYEKNAVITIYKILNRNDSDMEFQIFPLVNWRHFHSTTDRWKIPWQVIQRQEDKVVNVRFDVPRSTLMLATTQGHYSPIEKWIEKLYFREEAERGESRLDDCYQLGCFEINAKAKADTKFAVIAVADMNEDRAREILDEVPISMYDIEALYERETKRRENCLDRFYQRYNTNAVHEWLNWIILAANMFVVKGVESKQRLVIAGYHWFETWGRDTFVSLPGLMLVTGRFEEARKVLLTFKSHCKQGLIPNFLSDHAGQPAYNAVDSTLWYVNAVLQYLKYTGDFRFVQEQLWETLKKIIEDHIKGETPSIHMGNDFLLDHGPQLTWMDAAIDGQPVTPRAGKAVEVQALWYNALKSMALLADKFRCESDAEKYAEIAEKARKSFAGQFWNPEENCLFDVISENGKDASFRPNQIFAVALDFTMLDSLRSEKIVDSVHHELLASCGLRTLSRKDPKYIGVYKGDRRSRDKAYHNGTVWPWLLGSFTTAFLKAKGFTEYRRKYALENFLLPLLSERILESGLGVLNEIFDGGLPHKGRGCIAQAWSIAEPLRAYVEDVMQVRPKYEKEVMQGS